MIRLPLFFLFFFNDTATTEIYTLSLHDALPISDTLTDAYRLARDGELPPFNPPGSRFGGIIALNRPLDAATAEEIVQRSEEHTSELQSPCNLVCRLLLEKKKQNTTSPYTTP